MQSVDERAVALDLLIYFSLFASKCLGGELIVSQLWTGQLSESLHNPGLHVISISLKLVQGHRFLEALLSELGCLRRKLQENVS